MTSKSLILPPGVSAVKPYGGGDAGIARALLNAGRGDAGGEVEHRTQDYVTAQAQAIFGERSATLSHNIADTQTRYDLSQKVLNEIETRLAKTPRRTPVSARYIIQNAAVNDNNAENDNQADNRLEISHPVAFADWEFRHKCGLISAYAGGVTVTIMGAATAFAALQGSGIPAFAENSLICAVLSAIVPAGAYAMKSLGNLLPWGWYKLYNTALAAMSAVAFIAWAALFAVQFGDTLGGDIWSNIDDSGMSLGGLYSGVQLLAEITIGATLFSVGDYICRFYSPGMFHENREYEALETSRKEQISTHQKLSKTLCEDKAALEALNGERAVFIATETARLLGDMARFQP